jgi:hypothetical protein
METKFFFEQLQIPAFGEGALFSGEAILVQDGSDRDSFVVEEIRIGDNWLQPYVNGSTFSQHLFKAIADVLYDDSVVRRDGEMKATLGYQAALEWADFTSQARAA